MAIMLWFSSAKLSIWLTWGNEQRLLHLAPILLGAVITYVLCLLISGLRPKDFKKM
jgi:hypothetical protein